MNIKKYLFLPLSITLSLASFQAIAEQKMLFEGLVKDSITNLDAYGELARYEGYNFSFSIPANWQTLPKGDPHIQNNMDGYLQYREYEFSAGGSSLQMRLSKANEATFGAAGSNFSVIYQDQNTFDEKFTIKGKKIEGVFDFVEFGFYIPVKKVSDNITRNLEVYLLMFGDTSWFSKDTSFEGGSLPFDKKYIMGATIGLFDMDNTSGDYVNDVSEIFIDITNVSLVDDSVAEVPLPAAAYLFGSALLLLTGRKKIKN